MEEEAEEDKVKEEMEVKKEEDKIMIAMKTLAYA